MLTSSTFFPLCRHHFLLQPPFLHHHFLHLCRPRKFSTNLPTIEYPLSHPIYTIWAANRGLGKTLVSAGLAASFLSLPSTKFIYLKPVQTGYPTDSDSAFVYRKFSEIFLHNKLQFSAFASNHVLKASFPASRAVLGGGLLSESEEIVNPQIGFKDLGLYEERRLEGGNDELDVSELVCKTLYGWREAISPHLAAEREGAMLGDSELLELVMKCLGIGLDGSGSLKDQKVDILSIIETAGGVASPGPSGLLQCDLYRPFRLPAILVGDGRLGGISGTISAYESLKLRGYDIVAIIFEDRGLVNEVPLMSYLRNRVPVLVLPPVPRDMSDNLTEWFDKSQDTFSSLKEIMLAAFLERKQKLNHMRKKATEILWWPFTQHKLVQEESITLIDSRFGENFAVHKVQNGDFMTQQFDACASWWTQGPDASLQIELARDMGYAASRFGHVMFPNNVYEPALECADLLLKGVGKGWASRTFFTDNGSTAIEVALKMAFRKFSFDHGIVLNHQTTNSAERCIELMVLTLRGSYHGDTLGAMEAQAPSCFTGFLQQPWYTGRGIFLDPPTIFMNDGVWKLSLPKWARFEKLKKEDLAFSLRDKLFNKNRDNSSLAGSYLSCISQQLSRHSLPGSISVIGALIIEPVIQGSGGMHMVDPLFQRLLVRECQNRNIPVIFDEVFVGFWRLGVESAAELLCCQPDIACFAKLMTGGIVPLAATLATSAVFDAFVGDSKLNALLHGHSYTAHALGCTAAAKSIKWFRDLQTNLNLTSNGTLLREKGNTLGTILDGDGYCHQDFWDLELVQQISLHPAVERVVALGTLFALELRTESCDAGLVQRLREDGIYMRPLGNVIYLMCGPCTSPQLCLQLLEKLYRRLEEFTHENENCLLSTK